MKIRAGVMGNARYIVVLALLAVGIATYYGISRQSDTSNDKSAEANCTGDDMVARFETYRDISSKGSFDSAAAVEAVRAVKGFEQNIDCQYVLGSYYAHAGMLQEATDALRAVVSLSQEQNAWVSDVYGTTTVEDLQAKIDFYEAQIRQFGSSDGEAVQVIKQEYTGEQ